MIYTISTPTMMTKIPTTPKVNLPTKMKKSSLKMIPLKIPTIPTILIKIPTKMKISI